MHGMPRLVLLNGAPGSGKSTLAHALAQDRPLTLALDIDTIRHSLGRWADHPSTSGNHARRLTLAIAREHLLAGHDVVIGQYLARTPFIEELAHLAAAVEAEFHELVIDMSEESLRARLAARASHPTRLEHEANNALVGPDDAGSLVSSLEPLRGSRPDTVWVDGSGSLASTLGLLRNLLP